MKLRTFGSSVNRKGKDKEENKDTKEFSNFRHNKILLCLMELKKKGIYNITYFIIFRFFYKEFQHMVSTLDDCFLSSDQDTNWFLV